VRGGKRCEYGGKKLMQGKSKSTIKIWAQHFCVPLAVFFGVFQAIIIQTSNALVSYKMTEENVL
jgi:hypothetical protein